MSNTLWTVVTVVAVLGIVLFALILKKLLKAYKEENPAYQPLQWQFGYKSEQVQPDPVNRRVALLMIPLLFYIALALAVTTHNAAAHAWMRYAMYALAAGGCFAAVVETLLLYAGCGKAAPVAGWMKWALLAVWTLGMFAGLVLKGWAL